MGLNSGLFKCNSPDYIEKEGSVQRDPFERSFFEIGSRDYFVPCDNLPFFGKLLEDCGFFINTPHCTSHFQLLRSVIR
jgi:hypothetical protein